MPTIENYGSLSNITLEIGGISRTLKEWAKHYHLPYATVRMRYKRGERNINLLFFKRGEL